MRDLEREASFDEFAGLVRVENTPMQKLIERQGSERDKEVIRIRFTPWIFMYWTYELEATGERREGSRSFLLRYRLPDWLFDPLFLRLTGLRQLIAADAAAPKGDA
jgi:hypothetical protein